jgi:fructosamine-3-kinase
MNSLPSAIESAIAEATGRPFRTAETRSLGGGCIHHARRLAGKDGRSFFVKSNTASFLSAFEAERHALEVIAGSDSLRVPLPVACCSTESEAALILEFLPIGHPARPRWEEMGRHFARLHRTTGEAFGWPHDNWLGSSPQINDQRPDWVAFYRDCRLRPQVEWARERGLKLPRAEDLMERLDAFFQDYQPAPSLLHGDLWSGNAAFLEDGTPVVFDTAAYYGDREADLAMTEMFGGFPPEFYHGYSQEWPLDPGYAERRPLYLLYHVLNHFTIFGGGYGSQAKALIDDLCRKG